jgi:Rod binding domain-containing protein
MIGLEPISRWNTETAAPRRPSIETHKEIHEAASQFESLLLAQMLRQIRETGSGGWMGEGADQSASSLMGVAEEQLAQVLASQGGLGLAKMTADQIVRESMPPVPPELKP